MECEHSDSVGETPAPLLSKLLLTSAQHEESSENVAMRPVRLPLPLKRTGQCFWKERALHGAWDMRDKWEKGQPVFDSDKALPSDSFKLLVNIWTSMNN